MVFSVSFLAGLVVCLFFIIHENFCRDFRVKGYGQIVIDIVFWLLAAVFTFSLLQIFAYGKVRWFIFLGFGWGWYSLRLILAYFRVLKEKIKAG